MTLIIQTLIALILLGLFYELFPRLSKAVTAIVMLLALIIAGSIAKDIYTGKLHQKQECNRIADLKVLTLDEVFYDAKYCKE